MLQDQTTIAHQCPELCVLRGLIPELATTPVALVHACLDHEIEENYLMTSSPRSTITKSQTLPNHIYI
jgi:hypothetical protein